MANEPTESPVSHVEQPSLWERRSEASGDGIASYRLRSWPAFLPFLEREVFGSPNSAKRRYIWRGQRRDDWSLSSSLDRVFEKIGLIAASVEDRERRLTDHLREFKYASRGRRGLNPPKPDTENDWWALGQHYGLATPLLDWLRSPFAAAYFAFEYGDLPATPYRVVFGLDRLAVDSKNNEIDQGPSVETGRAPVIEFIDPLSDENPRLVSQAGLFTRAPVGIPIERWVAQAFEGSASPVLLRIEIPDGEREICLRTLNTMNINHLSLFPDLTGASRFSNLLLELGN